MYYLSPSILSADFTKLGEEIRKADEGGCDYIHFDVMDGLFVPSISYGMPVLQAARKVTDKVLDVHLMIKEPERYLEEFAKLGSDLITVHFEAVKDPEEAIKMIHALGVKAGMAVNPETPVEVLYPYLEMLDMALVMTVHPGFGGQKYIESCTDKVRNLKKEVDKHGLKLNIEVDGGINLDNVEKVMEAGANVIVAGSAIFKNDIVENVRNFKKKFQ